MQWPPQQPNSSWGSFVSPLSQTVDLQRSLLVSKRIYSRRLLARLKDPEKHKKHLQNCPSAISGSIRLLWSDEHTFCSPKWRYIDTDRETNCWINVIISIFFAYKKYSRRFIKFRLNHWWQMDYFEDVFYTFLGLDSVIYLAVNGTDTSLPVSIQNILNCVSRMNEAFTGLERHRGKLLMTKFAFWGGVSL